jgi:hypothetical protein
MPPFRVGLGVSYETKVWETPTQLLHLFFVQAPATGDGGAWFGTHTE